MTISEPRLRSLLRQAKKVADSGKRSAARTLYRQIIEEAPRSEAAWLGLAEITSDKAEQQSLYEHVLEIAPENHIALDGLARLQGQPASTLADPATPDEAEKDLLTDTNQPADEVLTNAEPHGDAHDSASEPSATDVPHQPDPQLDQEHTHGQDDSQSHDLVDEVSYDLMCYRHENRETSLRCYSCARPICSQCAVKTPVGYRCPSCIREAEEVFFTATTTDYMIAPLISLPMSVLAGWLVLRFGGGFFMILIMLFIGGTIGGLIGRVTRRAVGGRRGRYLPHLVAGTVILGVLIPGWPIFFFLLTGNVAAFSALIIPGIYLFVATGAAFYQMK